MDNIEWFYKRVSQLRTQKGVSAREMSLAIGQNSSYINRIENKITLPSMQGFFYICEFLRVTPQEFFDTDIRFPLTLRSSINMLNQLDEHELEAINHLLMVMLQNKKATVK